MGTRLFLSPAAYCIMWRGGGQGWTRGFAGEKGVEDVVKEQPVIGVAETWPGAGATGS